MLPLSKNVNLSRDLGMRHRAGIGMSENSDAVVVIVSEETGTISVAIGGLLKRHLKPETLEKLLINELMPQTEETEADKPQLHLPRILKSGRRTTKKWSKLKAAGRFASACRSSLRCSFGSTPTTTRRSRSPSTMSPIEFTNEDTTLADKGLMLLSNEEETIDLKLSMPRSTYFKLDPGKIRIVVDLSSVTTTGTQTITYSVLYPRGPRGELLSSSITQKEPTVRSTTIEIGELFRKNVEIRCKVVGNVAEGYIAGTVRMLPETLEVRGQQVDIMQVSYAQVTLNIENATSTVVELLGFELYDFSDQLIRSNRIHPASESIQVTMPVMTVKEVPLTVEFVETPGSRLENVKWALTPIDTITLSGDASTMAAIDEIKLDTLCSPISRRRETFTYDIPLPDGVDNLSGVTGVTLTILFDDIDSLTVDATQFGYENLTTERDVTVVTSTLSVTLRGTSTALAQVNEENLRVVADLTNVSDADGVYTVPATVYVDGLDVGAVGSYQVTVRLSGGAENSTEHN